MKTKLPFVILAMLCGGVTAEPLGEYWGTEEEESKYYRIVEIPFPKAMALEAGSFDVLPDTSIW